MTIVDIVKDGESPYGNTYKVTLSDGRILEQAFLSSVMASDEHLSIELTTSLVSHVAGKKGG